MNNEELSESHKRFCENYIFDFNATRAYEVAYPNAKKSTAGQNGHQLLKNTKIKEYIEELQADMAKTSGISRLRVLRELEKMAFSSIAHMHNTWVDRKEFEELTDDQKACISDIETRVTKRITDSGEHIIVEQIKIKLYDKHKAIDSINRMLGYNEPDKVDFSTKGESINKVDLEKLDEETLKKLLNAAEKHDTN